jgi:hypothetical protein
MAQFQRLTKAPDTVLDFGVDWSQWLATGDTITAVTWTIIPVVNFGASYQTPNTGAETLATSSSEFNSTFATIWLTGGVLNWLYQVRCQVTTAEERTQDQTFEVFIDWK